MLKKTTSLLLPVMVLLALGNADAQNQQVITDDGREVLLNEDGSWMFKSNDRYRLR